MENTKKSNCSLVASSNGFITVTRNRTNTELNKYIEEEKEVYTAPKYFNSLHYKKQLACPSRKKIASVILQSLQFVGINLKITNYKSISSFRPVQ